MSLGVLKAVFDWIGDREPQAGWLLLQMNALLQRLSSVLLGTGGCTESPNEKVKSLSGVEVDAGMITIGSVGS